MGVAGRHWADSHSQANHTIMKISDILRAKKANRSFSALALFLLLILWMLGAAAMLVGSAVVFLAYIVGDSDGNSG